MPDITADNTALLKEIKDNYKDFMDDSREIRDEGKTDMRYVGGDPWEPDERKAREDNDRPCMTWDELSPYINQLVNEPRQNKRAIKVNPRGSGADDKTAETRGNLIREIQYNSRAQSALTTAFQGAAERSYGYFGINARFVSDSSFEQELYFRRIPNPDTVLFNQNYKEQDCSDSTECFVTDVITKNEFKSRYPKAERTSFDAEIQAAHPQWIMDKHLQIAEYWKVSFTRRTLLLIDGGTQGPITKFEDELASREGLSILKSRDVQERKVCQYITNGVEILEETDIPIPWIPIIPVFGKEIWVDDGSGAKRKLMSLVRLARDPFMFYCFARSQEAEEAGLTPKVPLMGYKGQFETSRDILETINKIPRAFVEIDPMTDPTGQQILPMPTRMPFQPNFQAYEIACEAARRAIMTAMGGSNLPTAAQRRNEKSGAALKEIDAQEDKGTFHFIDNYNFALEHAGRILDAWIPHVYDTAREIGIREPDESHKTIRINDPQYQEVNDEGQSVATLYDTKTGEHGVTIATGPDFQSQRDEASAFVDTLIANLKTLEIPPDAKAKMLAIAIKMKQLGPLADEMADIISPPQDKQEKQNAIAQGQQKLQQQAEMIHEMQLEIEKLRAEKAGKVVDNEYMMKKAQMDNELKLAIAEITTKAQMAQVRGELEVDLMKTLHVAAHEAAQQAVQYAHEQDQAQKAQAAAQQEAQVSASSDATNSGQENTQ